MEPLHHEQTCGTFKVSIVAAVTHHAPSATVEKMSSCMKYYANQHNGGLGICSGHGRERLLPLVIPHRVVNVDVSMYISGQRWFGRTEGDDEALDVYEDTEATAELLAADHCDSTTSASVQCTGERDEKAQQVATEAKVTEDKECAAPPNPSTRSFSHDIRLKKPKCGRIVCDSWAAGFDPRVVLMHENVAAHDIVHMTTAVVCGAALGDGDCVLSTGTHQTTKCEGQSSSSPREAVFFKSPFESYDRMLYLTDDSRECAAEEQKADEEAGRLPDGSTEAKASSKDIITLFFPVVDVLQAGSLHLQAARSVHAQRLVLQYQGTKAKNPRVKRANIAAPEASEVIDTNECPPLLTLVGEEMISRRLRLVPRTQHGSPFAADGPEGDDWVS